MRHKIPSHLRPVAFLMGAVLSGIVMISDSPLAVGASLVLLASALIVCEGSALLRNVGDDSG